MKKLLLLLTLITALFSCKKKEYDVIIRHGMVYDGSGAAPVAADVALQGDTIAVIGDLSDATAKQNIDAKGKAVTPGFINMLSWATESLILDGNSQSDIRQGVTLEVFGEGESMGPLNEKMKRDLSESIRLRKLDYQVNWTTLSQYLESLQQRGIAPNIASFIGATTVRVHELAYANRQATADEMSRMKTLVRQAMEGGALGVGASLIYAPANYASTEELIELCKVAREYGGLYITHMRSEGNSIEAAVDETIRIAREAKIPAEIYHWKFAGKANWTKLDSVTAMIQRANASGLHITADMYTYVAGATGLDAAMPPWVQEGGIRDWINRMKDPEVRKRVILEMHTPTSTWENLMLLAGDPEKVLLLEFANDSLRKLFTGKTLAYAARTYGKSPEETAMDLVIADGTRVGTAYFLMDEDNIKKQLAMPFVSLGSDAPSPADSGQWLQSREHPRAYGNFSRFLARYVRDEKVMSFQEAIRRMTSLPAGNLRIKKRGLLQPGFFADVVVLDPVAIQDHATFENPHQYSTGVSDVFVNGIQVLANGNHTGKRPGRVVRGPGWTGK